MLAIDNADGYVFDGEVAIGGKVIRYTGDETIPGIPTRDSIIRKCGIEVAEQVEKTINVGAPIRFMPIDITEATTYVNRQAKYCLRIFGITEDGSKTEVNIVDIEVFFDVRVPDNVKTKSELLDFELSLRNAIEDSEYGLSETTVFKDITAFPIRGYNESPRPYKRIFTNTIFQRKSAIQAIRDRGWETASDDKSSYYRKVAREHKLSLSDWVVITDYTRTDGKKSPRCTYVLNCNVANYKPLVNPADSKEVRENAYKMRMNNQLLAKDRTMVMTWDIETHTYNELRELPDPKREGDSCFMICMTIHWKDSVEPLAQICIVSAETAPDPNWITVICDSQVNLLRAFALCWGTLSPDIQIGFRDSGYDWPYVVELANKLHVLEWMFGAMTAVPKSSYADLMKWEYNYMKPIKITAEETVTCSFLKIPGCVPIDVQICYKKLIPKSESTKLDFYLTISGLANKTDMPILRMWKYYVQAVTEGKNAQPETKEHMRQVAHYCVVDSISCQRLMVRRNIINEFREVSSLAYVSMGDSHFYAGGMRVCNLLGAYAFERNILMSMISSEVTETGKYPGAYVFQPEKGLCPNPVRLANIEAAAEQYRSSGAGAQFPDSLEIALEEFAPDRPVTGLDFSSLYPSLIMTYNLSLEKMVLTKEEAKYWESKGKNIYPIEFMYNGRQVYGWSIRHNGEQADIGLFPSVLIELFAKRAEMKTILGRLSEAKELIDVIYGNVKSSQVTLHVAMEEVEAEAKSNYSSANSILANGGLPTVSPGGTLEEELTNLHRTIKKSEDVLRGITHLRALPGNTLDSAVKMEYDRLCFDWVCINSKQNALKVYMNTFYGETGTSRSPLYLLQLAGGVTSAGRYNIKFVAEFVRSKGFRIKYGDTDSLYVVPPRKYFVDCDIEFVNGRLTREEWMGTMVRITMRAIAQLRDEVNSILRTNSKAIYLKMAFEEVLYPCLMCGMKKYFGIPHVNEVNFYPRDLFTRGIEVVKQGQPGLSKDIGYRIMWACMKTDNIRTAQQIVADVLNDAITNPAQWEFSHFIKSDTWRPHKDNKSVHNFIKRLKIRHEIEIAENTKAIANGEPPKPYIYNLPEPGERFKYVIVVSNNLFDIRGRKSLPKKGDRMELISVAKELKLEIDIPYYMSSHAVGLCARFINGDAEFIPPGDGHTDKSIDELSYKAAKKHIENYIKTLTGVDSSVLRQRGLAYRRAFKRANVIAQTGLESKLGTVAKNMLDDIIQTTASNEDEKGDFVSTMYARANVKATSLDEKEENSWCEMLAKMLGINKDGTDIFYDEKNIPTYVQTTHNLYSRIGMNNKYNILYAHQYGLAELDKMEVVNRNKMSQLFKIAIDVYERYELNLEHIVHELRKIEDNNDGKSEIQLTFDNITDKDKSNIFAIYDQYYMAISICLTRRRYVKYGRYIQALKDKRLGVISKHVIANNWTIYIRRLITN